MPARRSLYDGHTARSPWAAARPGLGSPVQGLAGWGSAGRARRQGALAPAAPAGSRGRPRAPARGGQRLPWNVCEQQVQGNSLNIRAPVTESYTAFLNTRNRVLT